MATILYSLAEGYEVPNRGGYTSSAVVRLFSPDLLAAHWTPEQLSAIFDLYVTSVLKYKSD